MPSSHSSTTKAVFSVIAASLIYLLPTPSTLHAQTATEWPTVGANP